MEAATIDADAPMPYGAALPINPTIRESLRMSSRSEARFGHRLEISLDQPVPAFGRNGCLPCGYCISRSPPLVTDILLVPWLPLYRLDALFKALVAPCRSSLPLCSGQ